MQNGMIKVITGVRRCGKTYLLFRLFAEYLRRELGVDDEHIIEIALDTEDATAYRDPGVLNDYLKSRLLDKTSQYHVLIDEVQYAITGQELKGTAAPRLYGVLNGLLRSHNVDVYVTGSNSKMLSTDVLTEFRGRGDEVRVRPLSFAEYMSGFDGDRYGGWAEYVLYGGMPLVLSMRSDQQKSLYLERLFAETYLKDIIARNGIEKTQELGDLVNVLASSVGSLVNPSRIEATFKSVLKSKLSANTIASYIGYLEDVGLRNARLNFRQVEENHLMENIIYNELRLRGFSVDVGCVEKQARQDGKVIRKNLEVDFVANLGSRRCYLQSAWRIPDSEKERQEKAPLIEVPDSFKKILLVRDTVKPTYDQHGILTMSVLDFLLNPNSLD